MFSWMYGEWSTDNGLQTTDNGEATLTTDNGQRTTDYRQQIAIRSDVVDYCLLTDDCIC